MNESKFSLKQILKGFFEKFILHAELSKFHLVIHYFIFPWLNGKNYGMFFISLFITNHKKHLKN